MKRPRPTTPIDASLLNAFLLTAQCGTMSGAAKVLGVTQPAVSAMLSRLEARLGLRLFERGERPIRLTAAGRSLKARAGPLMVEFERLCEDMSMLPQGDMAALRIGFSDNFGACVAPQVLQGILPNTSLLSSYIARTPEIIDKFLADEVDIAIATRDLGERGDVASRILLSERYLLVTPRSLEGRIKSIADLTALAAQLPMIRAHPGTYDSVQVDRILRQHCLRASKKRIEGNSVPCILGFVTSGVGWTLMAPLGIWSAREQVLGRIAVHNILNATRSYYVMHRSGVFDRLASSIASESLRVLRTSVLPAMGATMPHLLDCIRLEPHGTAPSAL